MFTGIIESTGIVLANSPKGMGSSLELNARGFFEKVKIGGSVAVNGVCLTLVKKNTNKGYFDVSPETLSKTNLFSLKTGQLINLERPVNALTDFSGHFVQGHVDCTCELLEVYTVGEWKVYWFEIPKNIKNFLVAKGSVCIDGVSLTVAELKPRKFSVALIPHTLEITTLRLKQPGDILNIEADMLAKYAYNACLPYIKKTKS